MSPFYYDRSPLSDGSDRHLEFLQIRAMASICYECFLYGQYFLRPIGQPQVITAVQLGENLRFWRKWVVRRQSVHPLAHEVLDYLDDLLLGLVEYLLA